MILDAFLKWILGIREIPETMPSQSRNQTNPGSQKPEKASHTRTASLLRLTKQPSKVFVNQNRSVDWVNPDGSAETVRQPRPCTRKYSLASGFRIGKRRYHRVKQLRAKTLDKDRRIYQDIHGQIVAEVLERFPCFDSYDAIYENRYYHWFYLILDGKLWHVYYEDEQTEISVTEDADVIDGYIWDQMVCQGWVRDVEVQTLTSFADGPREAENEE